MARTSLAMNFLTSQQSLFFIETIISIAEDLYPLKAVDKKTLLEMEGTKRTH